MKIQYYLIFIFFLLNSCNFKEYNKDESNLRKIFDQDTLWRIDNIKDANKHIYDPGGLINIIDSVTSKQIDFNPLINKIYLVKIFSDKINKRPLIVSSKGSLIIKKIDDNKYSLAFPDTTISSIIISIDCSKKEAYQLIRVFSDSIKYEKYIHIMKDILPIVEYTFKPQKVR